MTSVNSLAGASSVLGRVWTSLTRSAQSDQQLQPTSHVISNIPGLGLGLVCVCRDHKVRDSSSINIMMNMVMTMMMMMMT